MQDDIPLLKEDEGRPDPHDQVDFGFFEEGEVPSLDGISVHDMRSEDPTIEDSYALRFSTSAKAGVFSGDTVAIDRSVRFFAEAYQKNQ